MSIIRQNLEYYRLPPDVKNDVLNYDPSHVITKGSELRYYYESDISGPRRMVIDMVNELGERYKRVYQYYNNDNKITSIVEEYDGGTSRRETTFTYGDSGVLDGALLVTTILTDTEIDPPVVWNNMPVSTGWPSYDI